MLILLKLKYLHVLLMSNVVCFIQLDLQMLVKFIYGDLIIQDKKVFQ
jgi:hypothetical protein